MQLLLCDLISAHHHRDSVRGLMRRSFALLARKMVERNADHREQAIARDGAGYRRVMRAGLVGARSSPPRPWSSRACRRWASCTSSTGRWRR
jgi:hypothetical protein